VASGHAPEGLVAASVRAVKTGSPMGLQWKTLDVQIKHVETSSGLEVPIDKQGADYLVLRSSMEIINFPEYLEAITKIFAHACVSWTLSQQCFEATNAGIQIGSKDIAAVLVQRVVDAAAALGVKNVISPECGHAYTAIRWEGPNAIKRAYPFKVFHIIEVLDQLRAEGRIKTEGKEDDRLSLHDISLSVSAGEVLGLAGLEGSGQSLLLRACAGLLPVASGRVSVAGRDMTGQPYRRFLRAGVAFVPAARLEEGLIPGLTLREHVALLSDDGHATDSVGIAAIAQPKAGTASRNAARGHVVRNAPFANLFIRWPHADARAAELIQEFNVVGTPHTAVNELSGGNQQRALLALLPEHLNVLLMEHPTRGLDIESADWVWTRLLQRRDQGTAIIFTSTDLDELVENSDRIVVFSGGAMSQPTDAASITCDELGHLIGGRRP